VTTKICVAGREQPCPGIKAVINVIQWPDAFACICCNDTLDNHALFALARTSQSRGVHHSQN
jgi:hypothetical protein